MRLSSRKKASAKINYLYLFNMKSVTTCVNLNPERSHDPWRTALSDSRNERKYLVCKESRACLTPS